MAGNNLIQYALPATFNATTGLYSVTFQHSKSNFVWRVTNIAVQLGTFVAGVSANIYKNGLLIDGTQLGSNSAASGGNLDFYASDVLRVDWIGASAGNTATATLYYYELLLGEEGPGSETAPHFAFSAINTLILPSGATSGQRIVLDGTTGLIEGFDSSNNLIWLLGPFTGGGGGLYARGLQTPISFAVLVGRGQIDFQPVNTTHFADAIISYFFSPSQGSFLQLTSGAVANTDHQAIVALNAPNAGGRAFVTIGDNSDPCDLEVFGIVTEGNEQYGQVVITPVANSPTSSTVTGLSVSGTVFYGYASAVTTVIGSSVLGVATTSASATQVTVWVYRTNTVNTTVNWIVKGS